MGMANILTSNQGWEPDMDRQQHEEYLKIYACDFGFARKYNVMKKIYKGDTKGSITGSPRYMSIAAQKGEHQTNRDDLESLLYGLVELYLDELPWNWECDMD